MKKIECAYKGCLIVNNEFECGYCDECDFCPDNLRNDEDEENKEAITIENKRREK